MPTIFHINAHHDEYGFQPIVVFDGEGRFVTAVLCPAKRPSGREISTFLRRLLRQIRASWSRVERILARVEAGPDGTGTRFIATSLQGGSARALYERRYCQRGQAKNYIKSWKRHLAADRTSCTKAIANQVRRFLHGAAYWLMWSLRTLMPRRSSLRTAQFDTCSCV